MPYQAVSRALADAEIWVSLELLSEYRQVPLELEASEKISRDQMKSMVAGIAAFVSEANVCNGVFLGGKGSCFGTISSNFWTHKVRPP